MGVLLNSANSKDYLGQTFIWKLFNIVGDLIQAADQCDQWLECRGKGRGKGKGERERVRMQGSYCGFRWITLECQYSIP